MADEGGAAEGEVQSTTFISEEDFKDAVCKNCLDDEDAIAFCKECKVLLCEDCLSHHMRQVKTFRHEVIDSPYADEVKKKYCCDTHSDKTLDYFCTVCDHPICHHCLITTGCKDHKTLVSIEVRKELSDLLDDLERNKAKFCQHAEFVDCIIAQNNDSLFQCTGQINQAFDCLMAELEEQRKNSLTVLKNVTEKNSSKIEQQKHFVRETIDEMEKMIIDTKYLLKTHKEAKLMVNRVNVKADLSGRILQAWNQKNATLQSWQLSHRDQREYSANFSHLIPKPNKADITLAGLEQRMCRVGVTNIFKVTVNFIDQLYLYDSTTITNFLSVNITFKPANRSSYSTTVRHKIERDSNTWTVSFFLRQHGTVSIFISVCGIEPENNPFKLSSDPARKEIEVNDRVVRGPDWKWDNQDGGEGNKGRVVSIKKGWVNVKWDNVKKTLDYRWGDQDSFDLKVVHDEEDSD